MRRIEHIYNRNLIFVNHTQIDRDKERIECITIHKAVFKKMSIYTTTLLYILFNSETLNKCL